MSADFAEPASDEAVDAIRLGYTFAEPAVELGVLSVDEAYRQIALHIGLIVHVHLVDDTWRGGVRTRKVSQVIALTGAVEGNRPVSHLVYQAETPGTSERFQPEPRMMDELSPFLASWRAEP